MTPVFTLVVGLLLAGGRARQALGGDGDAEIILRLLFDRSATKGVGVLQPWKRRVGLLDPALLPRPMFPLLSPFLLLQLVSFSAFIWVQGWDCVLEERNKKGTHV